MTYPYSLAPATICVGTLQMAPALQQKSDWQRQQWLDQGGYCERQAVCLTPMLPEPYAPQQLAIALTDYAVIHTLRQQGLPVMSVTAGAFLYDEYEKQFCILKRAPHLHLFPNTLAPFGGHYCPDQPDLGSGVWTDTLHLELMEETGLDFPVAMLTEQSGRFFIEPKTGALFWFVLLNIHTEQANFLRQHQSVEGNLVWLTQSELQTTTESEWSALGWQIASYLKEENS